MSDPRRHHPHHPRRLAAALALAPLLSALLNPAAASAAAAPAVVTGSGWAGYIATGGTYTSVASTWIQPAIKCTANGQYIASWVGLDGYSSSSVEQTGTEMTCAGTTPEYSAWYEMYPASPVTYSSTVKPGDKMTASVVFSGTSTYVLTITDSTQGWSHATTKSAAGLARSSAETVVEASTPLSAYGSIAFTGCTANGAPLGSSNPIVIASPGLTVSPITNGTNFSVSW